MSAPALPRPATSFPGVAPVAPAHPPCAWIGPDDGPLADAVADHVLAAGSTLGAVSEHTALVIAAAEALPLTTPLPVGAAVLLLAEQDLSTAQWEAALACGARAVLHLPEDSLRLLEWIRASEQPHVSSRTVVVTPGHGGAGASSFAARLAGAVAGATTGGRSRAHSPCVLIDADPHGGGMDVLIEAPPEEGLHWEDLHNIDSGAGQVLLEGLPRVDGVSLLTAAGSAALPTAAQLRAVLEALGRTTCTVIVDASPLLAAEVAASADHLLLVTCGTDHAVASTARRIAQGGLRKAGAQLVVRREGPLSSAEVQQMLGLPRAASFRNARRGDVPLLDRRRHGADREARRLVQSWQAAT